jgi:hypothetical protein
LQDGTQVALNFQDTTCEYKCGNIKVDIDGFKGPFRIGQDYFYFAYTKNSIIARGEQDDPVSPFETDCNLENTAKDGGAGCAAGVIFNENINYLHCNNLSWDGPTKCK